MQCVGGSRDPCGGSGDTVIEIETLAAAEMAFYLLSGPDGRRLQIGFGLVWQSSAGGC